MRSPFQSCARTLLVAIVLLLAALPAVASRAVLPERPSLHLALGQAEALSGVSVVLPTEASAHELLQPENRVRGSGFRLFVQPLGNRLFKPDFVVGVNETGLNYAKARFYDPLTGRFLSSDPAGDDIRNPPSLHKYLYAFHNPTAFVDPDGRTEVGAETANNLDAVSDAVIARIANAPQVDTSGLGLFDTIKARVVDAVASGIVGVAAAAPGVLADAVGIVDTFVTANLARDAPGRLGDEARAEIIGKLAGAAASLQMMVENPGAVAGEVLLATGEKAAAAARGDRTAIAELTRAGAKLFIEAEVGSILAGEGSLARNAAELIKNAEKIPAKMCFVAGTLVLTSDGLRPIEEIEIGDLVMSRSDVTGEEQLREVVQTFVTPGQEVLEIELEAWDGQTETIGVTHEHPFWVVGFGWVKAGELVPGLHLFTERGGWLRVRAVRGPPQEKATVYNFEVAEDHTYFAGTSRAWVHNRCPDEGGGSPEVVLRYKRNPKHSAEEFARQTSEQAEALGQRTAGEIKGTIERVRSEGRLSETTKAARRARRENPEAAKGKAALHPADACIGGDPCVIKSFGDSGVNSSLGSQNRNLQPEVYDTVKNLPPDDPVRVRLELEDPES